MVKQLPQPQNSSVETSIPELDARTISLIATNLIDDLLVHPLKSAGRLSDLDLSTVEQLKGTIGMLGEKAGTLEDWIEGAPQKDQMN
jgi:hypothetical protein